MGEEILTSYQYAVLYDLLAGKTRKQIAARFAVSPSSLSQIVAKIRRRLVVRNDIELGAWAERNKIMPGRT